MVGTYDWWVKSPLFLANRGSVQLSGGSTTTLDTGNMRSGDCNDDNLVDSLDFNILKVSFGKSVGDPGYDPRADLNGDGIVDALDFNWLKINFGSVGAQHP